MSPGVGNSAESTASPTSVSSARMSSAGIVTRWSTMLPMTDSSAADSIHRCGEDRSGRITYERLVDSPVDQPQLVGEPRLVLLAADSATATGRDHRSRGWRG